MLLQENTQFIVALLLLKLENMLVFNKSLSNSHLQTAGALDRERGDKGKEGSKKPKTN